MAKSVAIAVRLTDKAVFPLAKCVMKFEMLPPGQAATMNIPKAMLGIGFMTKTNKKVMAVSTTNWLKTPTRIGLGFLSRRLKSVVEISNAIPNITNAKAKFNTQSVSESKLIRSVSIALSLKEYRLVVALKLKIALHITKYHQNTF